MNPSAMKPEYERMTSIIKDTLRLIVKNGVQFSSQLSIQGLLAVNLDKEDMFVVHLDEIIGENDSVCHHCGQEKIETTARKRTWSESACMEESEVEYSAEKGVEMSPGAAEAPEQLAQSKDIIIKRERGDYKLHEDWAKCPDWATTFNKPPAAAPREEVMLMHDSPSSVSSAPEATVTARPSPQTSLSNDIPPDEGRDNNIIIDNDINVHKCHLCPYKSPHKGTLNRHMRIHLAEKPFKCPFCDYRSRFRSNLLQHCASWHPGEKGS